MSAPDPLSFVHRFEPATATGRPALLLLHGTGGDESDLLDLGRMLSPGSALLSPRGKVLEGGMPRFFRRLAEGVFDEADVVRRAGELVAALDVPVLFGASRKSFLSLVDRTAEPRERLGASIVAAVHAARAGVRVVRVHDVRATRQAIDLDVVLGVPVGHADRADSVLGREPREPRDGKETQ